MTLHVSVKATNVKFHRTAVCGLRVGTCGCTDRNGICWMRLVYTRPVKHVFSILSYRPHPRTKSCDNELTRICRTRFVSGCRHQPVLPCICYSKHPLKQHTWSKTVTVYFREEYELLKVLRRCSQWPFIDYFSWSSTSKKDLFLSGVFLGKCNVPFLNTTSYS
jgi:hypothetical protein